MNESDEFLRKQERLNIEVYTFGTDVDIDINPAPFLAFLHSEIDKRIAAARGET